MEFECDDNDEEKYDVEAIYDRAVYVKKSKSNTY